MNSNRKVDINGFIEIKDNPISKVGVFPYSGKSISPDLNPNEIYYVYRPAEELADPECIESFKLVPFINDHTMLGDGFTAPEDKGVDGVIGESIKFDGTFLRANLKIFAKSLAKLVQNGKKGLSLGYRCVYEPMAGIFDGKPYQFIQRKLRGNHGALVYEGRCGNEVVVLDSIAFDEAELKKVETAQLEKLTTLIEKLESVLGSLGTDQKAASVIDEVELKIEKDETEEKDDKKEAEDETEEKDDKKEAEDETEEKDDKKEDKKTAEDQATTALDADEFKRTLIKELNAKNELAENLSWHIGTFDHAEMTLSDVANYGLNSLGLSAPKGAETAVLNAFLKAKQAKPRITAMDANVQEGTLAYVLNKYK